MLKCWAEQYCIKRSAENCSEVCMAYVLLECLYTQSEMPKRYQYHQRLKVEKADEDSYKAVRAYMKSVTENVQKGKGLYLYGKGTGTGKTSLATAVMNEYFRKRAFNSNIECLGVFIHVPTFLERYRKTFSEGVSPEFQTLLDNLNEAPLVIWDDIGAEKPSDWVRERLLALLDRRVGEDLANIFTSNLTLAQLAVPEILGTRTASRIKGCTIQLEFKGADKRAVTL